MKLYNSSQALSPRRVRMFIAEKGIEIPMQEINILEGENLREDFLQINPRGLLPALELDDGTIIDESIAICRYLEELYPEPNLMGNDALGKAITECWQRHMEFDGVAPVADIFRNTFPPFADRAVAGLGVKTRQIPELAERGKIRFNIFLDRLDVRLRDNPFIAGTAFSIADITAFCVLEMAKMLDIHIPAQHEHTHRWFEEISVRPSAKA